MADADVIDITVGLLALVLAASTVAVTAAARGHLASSRAGRRSMAHAACSDRYRRAMLDLAGHEDRTQLQAVHVLERLAIDDGHDAAAILRILCAFVRADNGLRRQGHLTEAAQGALGVIGRNAWPTPIDLSGCDLTGAHLARADLRGAVLADAHLNQADLGGADLTRANLTGARLRGADLSAATLTEATLTRASAVGANLSAAAIRNAKLRGTDLTGANLTRADLSCSNLTNALLRRTVLDGARLPCVDLTGADLAGARLADAADLTDAVGHARPAPG